MSSVEPLKVQDAWMDTDWLVAMQEELNSFERNQVWSLVKRLTTEHNVIGTKWIFKSKQDENGVIIRNKASSSLDFKFNNFKKEFSCLKQNTSRIF